MTSETFIVNLAKRGAGLKPDIAIRPRSMLYFVPKIFEAYPARLESGLASPRRAMRKGRMDEADAPFHSIEKTEAVGRDLQPQPSGSPGNSQGGSGGAMPAEYENRKDTTRREVPGSTAKTDEPLKKTTSPMPDKVAQNISIPGTRERDEPPAGIFERHPLVEAKSESEFPSQKSSALEASVHTAQEPDEAAPSFGIKQLHSSIHKARTDLQLSGSLLKRHFEPLPSGSGLERHPLKKAHEENDQVSINIPGSEKQEVAEEMVSEPMVIETASQAPYDLDKENPSVVPAPSRPPLLPKKGDETFKRSEPRAVNIRIGTIEVHANISPESGTASKPKSYGFDKYVMIRSYLSEEL